MAAQALGFGRELRRRGLGVPTGHVVDFIRALEIVTVRNAGDALLAASAIFASGPDDLPAIEAAFGVFWRGLLEDELTPPATDHDQHTLLPGPPGAQARRSVEEDDRGLADWETLKPDPEAVGDDLDSSSHRSLYSAVERLRRKDFSEYSEEEAADARRFLRTILWRLPERRSRRRKTGGDGREIDVRKLLRVSLRRGGEIMELPRRSHRRKRRRLILLCDISGSMDSYSRMLLHFLHSVGSRYDDVEVFVFGTRLTRITRVIDHPDTDLAVAEVASRVHDWAGGTRIGEALGTFNRSWARRVAAHGAVILIISDGWDRGDPAQLRREMARLQRLSHRLIWLNPLLGSPAYQPLTQGMRGARPFVDDFLPANNIASLEALAMLLNRLDLTGVRR